MSEAHLDFETRSAVDLRKRGAAPYFACPHFRPLGLSYRIDTGPLLDWEWGEPCPDDLRTHVERGGFIRGFNVSFERQCLEWLHRNAGWPEPRIDRFRCTAAEAAAMSLPRSLDGVGEALGLEIKKDKRGAALIRKFCLPRRPRKGEDPNGVYFNEPHEFPDDYATFVEYRRTDVLTEEAAASRIVPLSDYEQQVYTLDQIINRRGVRIDRQSARAAIELAEKAKAHLDREMRLATGGYVTACSLPGKLVEWVQAQGVDLNSAAKAEITELLERDDIPAHVRKAVEIRQEAAKTSVAKLKAMLDRASDDGRIRGAFLYCGAGTGRWASTGVNFANMPRPRKDYENAHLDTKVLFEVIRRADPKHVTFMYGPTLGRPLHLVSDAIRGFMWAAPGHDFIQADYTSIEGAVIAWSSGEEWKVKAMHDIIADPKLPDLYRRTAAQIMNTTTDVVTKKHPYRQSVGKVSELACFTAETEVLTSNGVKAVVEVLPTDLLWDGVEWVPHSGVVAKGVRRVVDVDGIGVTPDHLMLTGQTWRRASELASDRSTLLSALATGSANLPSSVTGKARQAAWPQSSWRARVARRLTKSQPTTCDAERPRAVRRVLGRSAASHAKSISGTTMLFPTTLTECACSTVSRRASTAALTPRTEATRITAGAASPYTGAGTGARSSNTSCLCRGGTSRHSNSTGSTLTETTRRGTFVLSHAKSTQETGEKRKSYRRALKNWSAKTRRYAPVYDILLAGPRNRFTTCSRSGFLIAHNCGFGGGVAAFYSMSKVYGVRLDPLFPHVWETASEERREKAIKRYEACLKRSKEKTDELSREAWLACEIIKVGWRANNPAIAAGWKLREDAVRDAILAPGTITQTLKFSYVVKHGFLWARLPSGRCLAYGSPKLKDQVWARVKLDDGSWSDAEVMDRDAAEAAERKGEVTIEGATAPKITALGVNSVTKKWERFNLYGGLIAENDTQAVARDLLVNGMLKAETAGYPIVAHVYDEMIAEVPRGWGSVEEFERTICELPAWAEGLPLSASGWRGKRYRKD